MNIASTRKRRLLLILALVVCVACMSGTVFAATSNQSADDQDKAAAYFQKYSANPESSIGARGIDGQWAACTTVEGKTYQEQLDNKLAYIEELYTNGLVSLHCLRQGRRTADQREGGQGLAHPGRRISGA